MKMIVRVVVLTCLMAVAVTMAAFTLAGFRDPVPTYTGKLVLGAYGGSVAVFDSGDLRAPLEVTDIELVTLRESDRSQLLAGLPVASREELAALLEDLGS